MLKKGCKTSAKPSKLERWPSGNNTECVQIPVAMENDANAAALGEYLYGSGIGIDNFIYITISRHRGRHLLNGKLFSGEWAMLGKLAI